MATKKRQTTHEHLWFKAKLYGWGWNPVTWQGWLVTILYSFCMVGYFTYVDYNTASVLDTFVQFVVPFVVGTGALLFVCYKKGERSRWRWGQ